MLFRTGECTRGVLPCEIIRPMAKSRSSETYSAKLKNTELKMVVKAAGSRNRTEDLSPGLYLKQEAELLGGLRHPGIPQVYDFVEEAGKSYYIMSRFSGVDLGKYIAVPGKNVNSSRSLKEKIIIMQGNQQEEDFKVAEEPLFYQMYRKASDAEEQGILEERLLNQEMSGDGIVEQRLSAQRISEQRIAEKRLSEQRIWDIAAELCNILGYLHQRTEPIIHNDIKPGNIMLTKKGQVVLLDFGVAQVLRIGKKSHGWNVNQNAGNQNVKNQYNINSGKMFLGTLGYAAPECWREGEIVGPETDLFSLGATLYSLLEGKAPDKDYGKFILSDRDFGRKHRWQPVISRCTALNRRVRYQSAVELYQDLMRIEKMWR